MHPADAALLAPPPGSQLLEERRTGAYHLRLLRRDEAAVAGRLYRDSGEAVLGEHCWDWRFFARNPDLALLPGAFTGDGRLVALYPVTVRPVRVRGRDLLACQACRTLIHPEHRGPRTYLALMRFMYDRCWSWGIHFGFGGGTNEAALKVGARLMGYRPMYLLRGRERRLSLRLALGRRFGRAGLAGASVLDRLLRPRSRRPAGWEVGEMDAAESSLDDLWRRHRDDHLCLVRRDARELDWRWFRCPVPATVLAVRQGASLLAYVVLRRHQEADGARIATVLDLFPSRGEAPALLLAAAAAREAAGGTDFLRFSPCPGTEIARRVASAPWRDGRGQPDQVVLCRCSYEPERAGVAEELATALEGSNWYYCQGDSDFLD